MKTRKIITLALMTTGILLFACKSKTTESAAKNESPVVNETPVQKGRYAIKSGIVEYKTEVMGMEARQTLTFDDYGKKEVTDMEMEMMGTKIKTVTITRDGFIYTLDMEKKTGTKMSGSSPNIDFENLSEQMAKDMNLKKEGKEEFLGMTCEKMSIDYQKMSMKGIFLVYKGVALMVNTDMGTMKMKLKAEKFLENPEIPASKFEIPADIKFN
jgi:hypothetical protein